MKISIVGTGYVGLVAGVGLASKGHDVTCVDIDANKVNQINDCCPTIYEDGLEPVLENVLSKETFRATTDLKNALLNSEVTFVSVGTPSNGNGSIDLTQLEQAYQDISQYMGHKEDYHVFATRSTVIPGTTESKTIPLLEQSGKKASEHFGVCMTPEFLREGKALNDFLAPDRIIIGEHDARAGETIAKVYQDFDAPLVRTSLRSAELIKYASNAFLATKISFINELGNLCKELDVDTYEVARGMGLDHRISKEFFCAGAGFGGSCFPKDVKALVSKAKEHDVEMGLLEKVLEANEKQPLRMLTLLEKHLPDLQRKKIGVLGLAFKPGTDDVREARALPVIHKLLEKGALVKAYDPKAKNKFRELVPHAQYVLTPEEALDSDAVLIMTEWPEFEHLDYTGKIVIDGRRIRKAREAEVYEGICW